MKIITLIFTFLLATISVAQTTYVPDDNFENYLETHDANGNSVSVGDPNSMGNGVANDDYVTTANINTVTNLNVHAQNIADLTGIEDFSALTHLYCHNNQLTTLDLSQNTALIEVWCNQNQLTSLNLSNDVNIQKLYCYLNQLTALDLSQNTALTKLNCSTNQLTALDVTQNTGLTEIYCGSNQLTALDLTQNTNLTRLGCQSNQLTTLDLSNNTAIFDLNCSSNQLTALDLSNNTELILFNCGSNQLTDLDLSQNTNLFTIRCHQNQLTTLNIQNGNNTNIPNSNFYATDNPDLTCIQVDDASWSTTNWTHIDAAASFSENCHYEETYVPDDNFEAYLEANGMGNGVANDDYVTTANIENITFLDIHNQNISDLTGIEDFADLNILYCYQNNLTALDITHNSALTKLWCNINQLPTLDISQNTALVELSCTNNQLTSLDTSQNTNLSKLNCFDNQLNTLDLSNNTNLTELYCGRNQLNTLDLSHNSALSKFSCSFNQLSDLDLSQNTSLTMVKCNNNQLTGLNVKNGNNTVISDNDFDATGNPNLTCIQVDDASWSTTNWTHIDSGASFSENCSTIYYNLTVNTTGNGSVSLSPAGGTYNEGTTVTLTATPDAGWEFAGWSGDLTGTNNPATITMDADKTVTATFNQLAQTYVPDDNFEHYLEHHDASGNVVALGAANSMGNGVENDNYVLTSKISMVTHLNIHNQNISDLTGIQDFTALTSLSCYQNQLTNLDITNNTALTSIACNGNNLTSVDFSHNTNLTFVDVGYNQISSIDLSANTALETLSTSFNQLTDLDVSMLPNFVSLDVSHNHLTSVDFSHNTNLTSIDIGYNQISSIDLSSNTALEILSISRNNLTDLDVSMLPNFISLDVSQNHLTGLNVQNGNNTNFIRFNATYNPDLTCIFVDDPAWSDANWTNIDATSHFVANQTECDNLGIDDEALKSMLKVYPNPVKDQLMIQSETYQDLEVHVYSLIGQELIHQKSNSGNAVINLKSLPAATYVVKITIDSRSVYYNVIKE